MSPDPKQHFGAITGLILASADGELIYNCVYCHRQIPDGEGALMGQAGEPVRARCYIHADGERAWQVPVAAMRTCEAVLIELARWVETPWLSPNWGPTVAAVARATRNAYLQRLSDLEREAEEEARTRNSEQ